VYYDLGLPKKVYTILALKFETERSKARRDKPFRRLIVSAINIVLRQYLYQNVAKTVQKAVTIFNNLSDLDISDKLLYMRALVVSA
jgi:hypothetical protein